VPVVGRENGDGNNNSSTMNTEALVALPELQQLDNAKVLICRGAGGRPLLADVLQQRGAQVDYCELYQRRFPDGADKILRDNRWGQTGDVVAVHSGESLQNWLQLVARNNQPEWLDLPLLVPGERVASIALDAGCKEIIMAHNASDSMMLSKLISWHRQ
jgi:uroporphyrinogen-III synthase